MGTAFLLEKQGREGTEPMIQEESTQRTVALMIRTTRLTESVLKKAMIMYLRQSNNRPETHGRISVRKLMGKDQGANTMEINNANIRAFNRVASKYNIDYAIQKDKTQDPPKYIVFFKGRDADVISKAFKDFCDLNEKKRSRVSLIEKLEKLKAAKIEKPQRERRKEKDREESR